MILKILLLIIFVLIIQINFFPQKKLIEKFTNLKLDVVTNQDDMRRGLMFKKYLPEDEGLLFNYGFSGNHSVWMKNTYIPLDVLFLDKKFIIIDYVENTKPLSLDSISIDKPSYYIVEVNANTIKKLHLKKGQKLNFTLNKKLDLNI